MRTKKELLKRISGYTDCSYIYNPLGYIVWRLGTGDNVEILFIEVRHKGKGHATKLVSEMLDFIEPYHSVFVFRLRSNVSAGKFYRKIGFKERVVPNLYAGGDAVLGVASYKKLCQNL